jgi:glycerophosphoryl diester phosphodiesterase
MASGENGDVETTQIWAHRGWRSRHPDNTAVALGAAFGVVDTVETDVRRSRDGRLVLSHDPALAGKVVAETDWTDLRTLRLGEGQRPLLLQEVLAAFPDRTFDIEIKNAPFEPGFDAGGAIAEEVLELARPGDVVTSFNWPMLDEHRALARRRGIDTGLLLDHEVPLVDTIAHAVDNGHASIAPSAERLLAWGLDAAVEATHDAGLRVVVWTVNDPDLGIRLAGAGVDAIITDDPGRLVEVLTRSEFSDRRSG